jgi:hypothetical protein
MPVLEKYYHDAPSYFKHFFDLLSSSDLVAELQASQVETVQLLQSISHDQGLFAYQPGKWTSNQVFRHIIDCERVFAYRALRFSRMDATDLPGFDHNSYALSSVDLNDNPAALSKEFTAVREASISLFQNLSEERLDFKGSANGLVYTPRTLGFMIAGHNLHHARFVADHYLST